MREKKDREIYSKREEPEEVSQWKAIMCRKHKGGVVKTTSKIGAEITPLTKTPEQLCCDIMQELLRSRKVVAECDASIKNGVMGSCSILMKREKE